MKIEKVMLMLDCVFDTVIGSARMMNEEEAERLIELGYLSRKDNHLSTLNPKINEQLFLEYYNNRNVETLKKSYTTNIINILKMENMNNQILEESHPDKQELVIILNTWPYLIHESVVKAILKELRDRIRPKNVKRIHLPISQLTPKYIKKNFNKFIIPSSNEWFKHHLKELRETQIALIKCIAPEEYLTQQDVDEAYSRKLIKSHYKLEYEKYDLTKTSDMINKGLSSHINLELLPLVDFSLCPPI